MGKIFSETKFSAAVRGEEDRISLLRSFLNGVFKDGDALGYVNYGQEISWYRDESHFCLLPNNPTQENLYQAAMRMNYGVAMETWAPEESQEIKPVDWDSVREKMSARIAEQMDQYLFDALNQGVDLKFGKTTAHETVIGVGGWDIISAGQSSCNDKEEEPLIFGEFSKATHEFYNNTYKLNEVPLEELDKQESCEVRNVTINGISLSLYEQQLNHLCKEPSILSLVDDKATLLAEKQKAQFDKFRTALDKIARTEAMSHEYVEWAREALRDERDIEE